MASLLVLLDTHSTQKAPPGIQSGETEEQISSN
jgi:hypothetical protein